MLETLWPVFDAGFLARYGWEDVPLADESLRSINDQLADALAGGILSKIAYMALIGIALFLVSTALYKEMTRTWERGSWESLFFILLCVSVCIWAVCALLAAFAQEPDRADRLHTWGYLGIIFIPLLLYLHTWQQVSYKELHPWGIILFLVVPAALTVMIGRRLIQGTEIWPTAYEEQWFVLVFYMYAFIPIIRSYLMCFNVFYQMPRHMRRSSRYMLASISSVLILFLLNMLWGNRFFQVISENGVVDILLPLAAPVAFYILLFPLYRAMKLMPASDVIVTSREFVVEGLATTILILSRTNRILDWNRKAWDKRFPLPRPFYREPIGAYRKRILELDTCRVSPHSEDIVTARAGDEEMHFMMHVRVIGNSKKHFGAVMEISEITPIYTTLRYFEEIAYFDQLTSVFNRNAYLDRVEKMTISQNMPLLILVGDVNKLKYINDTYGHLLGDQLLLAVAEIIKKAMPEQAFVARVGGDEFVILVPGGSVDMAHHLIQGMKKLCGETHHEIFGSPSISWGYAVMTSEEQSYNEVFSEADQMMYETKKNQYQFRSSGLLPEIKAQAVQQAESDSAKEKGKRPKYVAKL
ncbi:MAG: diguanylate cyclase [Peptococcaceae bacterium]|nr:diguanylate cyclase [Peptococcaceae bacterium]